MCPLDPFSVLDARSNHAQLECPWIDLADSAASVLRRCTSFSPRNQNVVSRDDCRHFAVAVHFRRVRKDVCSQELRESRKGDSRIRGHIGLASISRTVRKGSITLQFGFKADGAEISKAGVQPGAVIKGFDG